MGIISGIIELVKFIIDLTKNKSRITHINIPYKKSEIGWFHSFCAYKQNAQSLYIRIERQWIKWIYLFNYKVTYFSVHACNNFVKTLKNVSKISFKSLNRLMFSEFFLLKLLFHTNATKIRVIIKQVIEMHIKIQFIIYRKDWFKFIYYP